MNKLILLFVVACFLTSCATSASLNPVTVKNNSDVILKTNYLKSAPVNLTMGQKAVSLLNQLFNTDQSNTSMVLVVNNESDCDFTMHITGNRYYSLPVSANKSESIIVEQGEYQVTSDVCNTPYKAVKKFYDNTQLSIRHRLVKMETNNNFSNNTNAVATLH